MAYEQREPKISATLFTQTVEARAHDRMPNQSGYFDITIADLDRFYELCKQIEPELNYKNEPAIKLEIACWENTAKSGKQYSSCTIAPKKQTRFKPEEMPGDTPHHTNDANPVITPQIVFDDNERI